MKNFGFSSFWEVIKYGYRGPNLAVFFVRQGNLQVRISKEKIRLILMLNWDQLSWRRLIVGKDGDGT